MKHFFAVVTQLTVLGVGCQRPSAGALLPGEVSAPTASANSAEALNARRAPSSGNARSAEPGVSLEGGTWTAGIVHEESSGTGVAVLRAVRAARHEGLDRVVMEFEGSLPGYHVEYIDRPIRQCGSGATTELEGDGWLAIHFEPAAAHTEQGQALVRPREQRPALPIVREFELTCDFEAHVEIVLGVARPNRYRVLELGAPARLVVDIRHRR